MSESKLRQFLLCAAFAAASVALMYVTIRYLLPWLLPFLIASLIAAAIEPAVQYLHKRLNFKRSFASLVLTLFVLFLLGGLLSLLGTTLMGEADALLARIPALLEAAPAALDGLLQRIEQYSSSCPPWLRERLEQILARYAVEAGDLLGALANRLPAMLAALAGELPRFFLGSATSILAIYFTSSSLPELQAIIRRRLSPAARQKLSRFQVGMAQSVKRWLRAELILCAVTFSELLFGFTFLRQPYALLLAFLITLVDALPVFGTGTVLIPWAVVEMLFQNMPKSIILAVLYLITLIVRNVLEPRLLSAQAGLPPILSLLAMYLGFRAFGVVGMVLFPFLLLLGAQLLEPQKKAERS